MRKILWVLSVLSISALAYADSYEAVTVDATVGGVSLTAATYGRARAGQCRLETGQIRYTTDGTTAPTSTVGIIVSPMEWIILGNANEIKNFKAIRTGTASGSLRCFYFD